MIETPLLEVPTGCSACLETCSTLLAVVDGRRLCLPCWIAAGRPWPTTAAPAQETPGKGRR